ncbi:COP9 signalosome complex subunit 6 [Rhodotorula paludigena]|uniref:COP9 signalosome complex subunit 6 n=1 Tax=Rhodotorula paludigena TaxID=86838 RepID=UPI00316F6D77
MGSTQEGLKVALHPQPLLSISEHHTRISLQSGDPNARVVGALLGTQTGRDVEIMTSFEVVAQPTDSGALELDHAYFVTRRDQFKQVFPTFDVLGWYSVGDAPSAQDTALHKQFFVYNESPLFLQLSPSRTHSATKDLPVAIYESVLEIVADQPEPTFVPAPYEIVTGEAERVAVEGVSKPEEGQDGGASGSLLIALTTQRNALKMLSDRIAVLVQYLSAVTSGHARADPETLRMIAALLGSLQGSEEGVEAEGEREGRGLKGEFMTEYNDVLLTTYLSALTKQLLTANDLLDKQLLLVNSNSSGKEGGGGGGAGGGGGRSGGGGGASRRSKFEQFV